MKIVKNIFIITIIIFSQNIFAQLTAKQIVSSMLDRDDGKSSYTLNQLISCSFKTTNSKYKCISKPRIKVFENLSIDVGKNLKDTKALSLIIKPAAEKDMAFLQNDYDDETKDSQQWMYLPAMKKLKRIISEADDGAKTGSFFGSEISYEDIEKRHISDYSYEILTEEIYNKTPVWVIKSTPTSKYAKKTSYAYTKSWVDKEKFLPLKAELFDRQGRLKKTILQQNIKKMDDIWVVKTMLIINHANKRMSMMRTNKIVLNIDVPNALLGIRALNDANYREAKLKPIRDAAK